MKARIKTDNGMGGLPGNIIHYRVLHPDYDPKGNTGGRSGPRVKSGDVIEVTQQELDSFPDKLEQVAANTKLTYTPEALRELLIEQEK